MDLIKNTTLDSFIMDSIQDFLVSNKTQLDVALQDLDMATIQTYVSTHKIQLDFLWHLLIYVPLIFRGAFMRHFASSKMARLQKFPYIPLLAHMVLGVIIVFRYQYLAITSNSFPTPTNIDAAMGIINALISWRLSKYEGRGNHRITRVAFQTMSVMVFFPALMCYLSPDPAWYHALAKMHNAFIYVRWLIMYAGPLGVFENFHELYTISVFFGGILGVMEGAFPWNGVLGVPFALGVHGLLVIVEKWVSGLITQENTSNPFLALMLLIGLVEVKTYKELKADLVVSDPPEEVKT